MRRTLFFHGQNIAITGGTGFIGTPLVKQLRDVGAKIHLVLNLEDKDRIAEEFRECKYVFHLAATFAPMGPSKKDENYLMTKRVLDASIQSGVQKVFFASSAAVYPAKPSILPIPESLGREGRPNGKYGQSKRACEDLVLRYAQKYYLDVVIARIFNVYGPGDKSERFIPAMLKNISSGSDVYINNEKQTRDFIYIDDCVEGIIKCMEKRKRGQIFNICTGQEINLLSAASIIAKRLKFELRIKGGGRGSENIRSVGDISQAKKQLGFQAKTLFERGIKLTIGDF